MNIKNGHVFWKTPKGKNAVFDLNALGIIILLPFVTHVTQPAPYLRLIPKDSRLPHLGRPRPHALVQTDGHGVHGVDLAVERGLEVTVGTQTLLDESAPAAPGPEGQTLEPLDVPVVEEHVAHRDDALVDLVRVAG